VVINVSWLGLIGGLWGFFPVAGLISYGLLSWGFPDADSEVGTSAIIIYPILAVFALPYALGIISSVIAGQHRSAVLTSLAIWGAAVPTSILLGDELIWLLAVPIPASILLLLAAWTTRGHSTAHSM
jgi:hypothetical protein